MLKKLQKQHAGFYIGTDVETQKPLFLTIEERIMNNLIIGSIGTGIQSGYTLQILNQDLENLAKYINGLGDGAIYQERATNINGLSIFGDRHLLKNIEQLITTWRIPNEGIAYIDPLHEETFSINVLDGPIDEVAESLVLILNSLVKEELTLKQHNHLKQYIHLLKLCKHGFGTLQDLINMYNNMELVEGMLSTATRQASSLHESITPFKLDSLNDDYKTIIESLAKVQLESNEDYLNLRDSLNALSENKVLNKILLGDNLFDFERHVMNGGILLVNTKYEELKGLSPILDGNILSQLGQARTKYFPNDYLAYHHIFVSDTIMYTNTFVEAMMQSRPYKLIITIVEQTTSLIPDLVCPIFNNKFLCTPVVNTKDRTIFEITEKEIESASFWSPFHFFTSFNIRPEHAAARTLAFNFLPNEAYKRSSVSVEPMKADKWIQLLETASK